jgi:hypothetical protein
MATTKAQPKKDVQPEEKDRKYIIHSTRIDKHNTRRIRIELTPAVCEQCGFDFCRRNDLGSYWDLSADMQKTCREGVQAHIEQAHSSMNASIIAHEELPGRWLGEKMEANLTRKEKLRGKK